jgi:hypothetical protein
MIQWKRMPFSVAFVYYHKYQCTYFNTRKFTKIKIYRMRENIGFKSWKDTIKNKIRIIPFANHPHHQHYCQHVYHTNLSWKEFFYIRRDSVRGKNTLTWTENNKWKSNLRIQFHCIWTWLKIDHMIFIPKNDFCFQV